MKINYILTNFDFLEYQLYTSSKSQLIKKKRKRAKYFVFIVYILIGLYFAYINKNNIVGGIIGFFGLLWFVFYPKYSKWNFKRHFKKQINENYKNRVEKPLQMELTKDFIYVKSSTSESKISSTELKQLIETENHFFLKLITDLSFIIPKNAVENNIEFKKRATEIGAEYVNELNWTWK